jgi:hypothetical protein
MDERVFFFEKIQKKVPSVVAWASSSFFSTGITSGSLGFGSLITWIFFFQKP